MRRDLARRRSSRPRGRRSGRGGRGRSAAARCWWSIRCGCGTGRRPDDPAVPWDRACARAAEPRRDRPQTTCGAVLSQPVRARSAPMRPGAAAVRAAPTARGGGGGLPLTARAARRLLRPMYAESADPWQLAGRWYEQRKYAITLALLPYRALPARVRTRLFGRRAHRTARQPVRPRHRPPMSRRRRWMSLIAGWSTPGAATGSRCCGVHSTSLGRQRTIRPRGAVGGLLLPARRRAARRSWTARCRGWRRARPSSPHTGDTGRRLPDDR